MHRTFGLFPVLAALAGALAAQQVPVTLSASLPGESGKPLPVIGRFWFVFDGGRDSVPALTDGTGRAQVRLPLGNYRIRSHQRVTLAGRDWYWDAPVSIRAATHLELGPENARDTPPSPVPTALVMEAPSNPQSAEPVVPAHTPVSVSTARTGNNRPLKAGDPGYKDPGLAVLFGILLAGGGHFYAGESGKGVGILLGAIIGGAMVVSQAGCDDYYYECSEAVGGIGAVVFLGSWIFSIADASPAANRANRRQPSFSLRALPGERVGLAIRLPL